MKVRSSGAAPERTRRGGPGACRRAKTPRRSARGAAALRAGRAGARPARAPFRHGPAATRRRRAGGAAARGAVRRRADGSR
ncbi:MAG: hypothetical protein EPN51_26305 [Mycobacterium sp.]|nr:MAG: hypothetical protein EPN51_26305 [Mycobacterium sp.]